MVAGLRRSLVPASPWASSRMEPFCDTLVVALMRPDWLTARPTSVALPRGTLMLPVFSTLPAPVARSARPTSTSRPRRAGTLGLASEAYRASAVGSL